MGTGSLVLPIFISACVAAIIVLVAILIIRSRNNTDSYEDQLQEILMGEEDEATNEPTRLNIKDRWNNHWARQLKEIGWAQYDDVKTSKAGRDVIIALVAIFIFTWLALGSVPFGLIASGIFLYLGNMLISNINNRKAQEINAQLPGFLFALKANVEANETPERAILKIVDGMPSPLREDLMIVKERLLSNSTFAEAIEAMREKTASRELKFLCSCMLQASLTGSNIESQITTIQNTLEDRTRTNNMINSAARKGSPIIWLCTVSLPACLLFSIYISPSARDFWLHNSAGYVCMIIAFALYGLAIWGTRKRVEAIRNL